MISVRTVVPLIVRPKNRSIIHQPPIRVSVRMSPSPPPSPRGRRGAGERESKRRRFYYPLPASAGRGRDPSRSDGRMRGCARPHWLALAELFLQYLSRHLLDRAASEMAELKRTIGQADQPGDRIAEMLQHAPHLAVLALLQG